MKRLILSLFAVLAVSVGLRAQVHLGAEGGVTLNQVSFSKDVFSSDNRAGFFIGPKLKFVTPKLGLGFDVAALYSNNSVHIESVDGNENSKRMSFIEIPVNARWEIGSEKIGLYVATGPQWDLYIGDSQWYARENLEASFEHSYFSWNIGAGIMFLKHFQVGASYGIPLSKSGTLKETVDAVASDVRTVNIKNHQWQIRFAYFF